MTTELPDISKEALEAEKTASEDKKAIEIEVIDDTPPKDRGRDPLPKDIVDELEQDDLDEYSDKVKKRLAQMKKVWHDERREKERAAREREEAIAFARAKDNEVKILKNQLGSGQKAYSAAMMDAVDKEILSIKGKLKQAYESGDAESIADTQEALTDAKVRRKELEYRSSALQVDRTGVENTTEQAQPVQKQQVVDPKAEAWREDNTWFGTNASMTGFALGLHEELIRSGVDPRSNEYYDMVNKTMHSTFPKYFGNSDTQEVSSATTEREQRPPRKNSVVAAVSRTTAPSKIRLTASQVAIAKRLGLTPEAYAKEVVKLENTNG